jgi:amino acid transporter
MAAKKISLASAVGLGVSAIIGSGWLFAPYRCALVAGPGAIFSWIIAAVLVCFLGLCFSEIAALYPRRGLAAIIPTISHNKYFGFPFAVANWLGIVAVIPLEAMATIQYLIYLTPSMKPVFFLYGSLTTVGTLLAIALVVLFALVNYWGTKIMVKTNNIFAVLKVIIPVVVSIAIIAVSFHGKNFIAEKHSVIPYGMSSVFNAILSSGIIIAFNGFQTIVSFASEVDKPARTIPKAVVISILLCLMIYLLLQVAFIAGIPPALISHGWSHLSMYAPIIQLTLMLGLGMLTSIIYFGATVAPSGTGIAFFGASTRMFTAMSRNKQMPSYFSQVDPVIGLSRRSLLFNMGLAIAFLVFFRSWSSLAVIISLLHVLAYLPIPIALCVFRKNLAGRGYPYIVPYGRAVSLLLFVAFTYILSLSSVKGLVALLGMISVFQAGFILLNIKSWSHCLEVLKQCSGLAIFLFGLLLINYLSYTVRISQFSHYHGAIVILMACFFFLIFIRQSRNDDDIVKSAITIYK